MAQTENQDGEWLEQFVSRPAESDISKDNYEIMKINVPKRREP